MDTIKVNFVGKWNGITPEGDVVCHWLEKNGYKVEVSDNPDYIICDIFGNPPYQYCEYPQIRIMETGENFTPDFNVIDYAICRYPIDFQDRCFYLPGCACPGEHWRELPKKNRNYTKEFLKEKEYFANFISSHESEYGIRGDFFKKLCEYKRVESPGSYLNNMPDGSTVNWLNDSKTDFQRKCKFTLCFESTSHNGFVTEKITDAFYADTIPVYYGSPNVTDIFNKDAFINCMDYDSFDAVIEKIKELDQNDEKYLEMLRQPILVDPEYPEKLDRDLTAFILHIFEQPKEKAFRRSRVLYPKWHDEYLARAIEPTKGYYLKKKIKKLMEIIKQNDK